MSFARTRCPPSFGAKEADNDDDDDDEEAG